MRPLRFRPARPYLWAAALALFLLGTALGCGYRLLGTGNLPQGIRTVAVLPFERQVPVVQLDQRVTEAVTQEMARRLKVRVQSDKEGADAVLTGAIRSFHVFPLSYDEAGRANRYQVSLGVKVRLADSRGTVLYESQAFRFTETYARSSSPATFAAEEVVAYEQVARDFARALVSALVEGGGGR